MNTKHLKTRILDLALQGKLVENSRIPNDLNSRIPSDFNPPFEIPNSWQWVKLRDICEITSSKRILKSEYVKSGIPFYRTKEIVELSNKEKISTEFFISENRYNEIKSKFGIPQTNDLLISAVGTIGKIWLVDTNKPFYFKDGNLIWLKNSNSFNSLFLKYMLENQISKNKFSGTAYNALTIIFLKNLYIPLPPKDEQERIVKKIDELFSQIDILDKHKESLLKNIKHTKTRILDLALQGKLVENSRIPNDLNSRIPSDFNPPFEIPNSWQWVKLRDICEITSSKRILKSEYVKSGIPFYRTKEIVELSNKEKISTEFFISENRYNEIKSKFGIPQTNDLLISAVGTIGKIWLVDTNKPFYFKDGNLIWLKNSNSFNSLFLKYMLENQISKNKFSGTAYNALTIIFLKNLYIPLPPKDEQERIVKKIDELFEILEVIENSL